MIDNLVELATSVLYKWLVGRYERKYTMHNLLEGKQFFSIISTHYIKRMLRCNSPIGLPVIYIHVTKYRYSAKNKLFEINYPTFARWERKHGAYLTQYITDPAYFNTAPIYRSISRTQHH